MIYVDTEYLPKIFIDVKHIYHNGWIKKFSLAYQELTYPHNRPTK